MSQVNQSIHTFFSIQIGAITQEISQLRLRVQTVQRQADERVAAAKQQAHERVTASKQQVDERVAAAKREADEASKRERQAVKKREATSNTLETVKQLLRDVRGSRDQLRHEADEAKKRERAALRRATTADARATAIVDERVEAAKREVDEAKKRERQAVKKREATNKTLETVKQLLRDVRGSRDQLRHEVEDVKKRERAALRRAVTAEKQEADAQQRAVTAEEQQSESHKREQEAVQQRDAMKPMLQTMSSAVQPVPEKSKKFATHVWLAVTRVLGIQGQDLKRIIKASKHMHDTKSSTWEESVVNNTELIKRLRSVGKILITSLFACVRIRENTVPVEQVVELIFPIRDDGANGGNALEEIRKAVRAAVSERRMSDAKMLLTLSLSSFGIKKFKAMREYFTHIEPISTGCSVTFLTPDKSPNKTNKKIECRNYSYLSKAVTRGTVISVMTNGTQIKVRHRVPGVKP